MSTCGCFAPFKRWFKIVFSTDEQENQNRIIEIGPPTNFRKEEFAMPFSDDDQSTLHRNDSHGIMTEKEVAQIATLARRTSTKELLKARVLKLGSKLTL